MGLLCLALNPRISTPSLQFPGTLSVGYGATMKDGHRERQAHRQTETVACFCPWLPIHGACKDHHSSTHADPRSPLSRPIGLIPLPLLWFPVLRPQEGPEMRESLREERTLWVTDQIAQDKFPEDLEGFYLLKNPPAEEKPAAEEEGGGGGKKGKVNVGRSGYVKDGSLFLLVGDVDMVFGRSLPARDSLCCSVGVVFKRAKKVLRGFGGAIPAID